MVSQTQACYTASDGRRPYSRPYPLYFPSSERRGYPSPLSSHSHDVHHARALSAMTDPQLDSDSGTPQRKRIAVACMRCRKRKIRCSGDPGQGQPCSNCKNAGAEPCQFLRVASTETPFRSNTADFSYSVNDARLYASRGTPTSLGYHPQDTSAFASPDQVLSSYRPGSSQYTPYTPAPKAYYPGMSPAYPSPYGDEFDYTGIPGVASQSVLNQDVVQHGMSMAPAWSGSSGGRTKTPAAFSSIYHMDPEASAGTYSPYGSAASLMHRPAAHHAHAMSSEAPSFSFSNVAASLPASSSGSLDRLLPNPASRSSTLPYPTGAGAGAALKQSAGGPSSAVGAPSLADVASAASYHAASGFDAVTSSLSYSSSQHSASSRANSDSYSGTTQESIFTDDQRSTLSSNGPASFDLGAYTSSEPRRDSHSGVAGGGGSTNTNTTATPTVTSAHAYIPAESVHEAAAAHAVQVPPGHPSASVSSSNASSSSSSSTSPYHTGHGVNDAVTGSPNHAHAHPHHHPHHHHHHNHRQHHLGHAESRQIAAVAGRH